MYDIIDHGSESAQVVVNTSTAQVICGCIPNASLATTAENNVLVNAIYDQYHFEFIAPQMPAIGACSLDGD